jgi:hypothetical protein
LVDKVLDGYNATIFAYGQTGSGKTYTTFGSDLSGDNKGLLPRCVNYIFNKCHKMGNRKKIDISVSFSEVYLEHIRDLGKSYVDKKNLNLIDHNLLSDISGKKQVPFQYR